jgi:hypothetical protein
LTLRAARSPSGAKFSCRLSEGHRLGRLSHPKVPIRLPACP